MELNVDFNFSDGDHLVYGDDSCVPENIRTLIRAYQWNIKREEKPFDIQELIKDVGEILDINIDVSEEDITPNSGEVRLNKDGGYQIITNRKESARRKRFTLAHELAHLLLHKDEIGKGIKENAMLRNIKLVNACEREANSFAAAILMPIYVIRQCLFEEDPVKALSDKCGVSYMAAGVRLDIYNRHPDYEREDANE